MGHIHYQSFQIVKRVFSPQLKSSILLISQSSTTIALNTSRAMLKKSLARQLRSVSDGPVRFLLSKNSTKYSRISAELNSPHSTTLAQSRQRTMRSILRHLSTQSMVIHVRTSASQQCHSFTRQERNQLFLLSSISGITS